MELLRKLRIAQHNFRIPEHGVHGGSDFMGHIGKKRGFGTVCMFSLFFGDNQCFFFLFQLPGSGNDFLFQGLVECFQFCTRLANTFYHGTKRFSQHIHFILKFSVFYRNFNIIIACREFFCRLRECNNWSCEFICNQHDQHRTDNYQCQPMQHETQNHAIELFVDLFLGACNFFFQLRQGNPQTQNTPGLCADLQRFNELQNHRITMLIFPHRCFGHPDSKQILLTVQNRILQIWPFGMHIHHTGCIHEYGVIKLQFCFGLNNLLQCPGNAEKIKGGNTFFSFPGNIVQKYICLVCQSFPNIRRPFLQLILHVFFLSHILQPGRTNLKRNNDTHQYQQQLHSHADETFGRVRRKHPQQE